MPDNNSNDRFNPNELEGDLRQTAAANWELLRRSQKFQAVAKEWIGNGGFRREHVLERKTYRDNVFARCALDWLLTAEQRYSLARFQMQNHCFYWDPTANYGPIIVERHLERQRTSIRIDIANLFDVQPHPEPGRVLRTDQPWPKTPPLFRDQFLSILSDEDLKTDFVDERLPSLVRVGDWLTSGKPTTSEELSELGRFLLQLGEDFRQIKEQFKVFAIRNQFYSEQRLDKILKKIKDSIPYDPKTGRDHHSRRSFLGTSDQWTKFLAWEAHDGNAYRAAAEFLTQSEKSDFAGRQLPGTLSRSEKQRDKTAPIRKAVAAISDWIEKVYPERNVIPSTVRQPTQD